MIWQGWLFLGILSAFSLFLSFSTLNDDITILSAIISTMGWAIWSWQALNVEVITSGVVTTDQYPALTFFGAGLAVMSLYVIIEGPFGFVQREWQKTKPASRRAD